LLVIVLLALAAGIAGALVGGALSGLKIGGAALGNQLAALLGGLYGLLASIPGVAIGLAVLFLVQSA
jgi:hypothetical protein